MSKVVRASGTGRINISACGMSINGADVLRQIGEEIGHVDEYGTVSFCGEVEIVIHDNTRELKVVSVEIPGGDENAGKSDDD